MKTLKDYLKENRYGIGQAAVELGVSRQHISNAINKPYNVMSRKLAVKIEEWSGGEMTAASLLGLSENNEVPDFDMQPIDFSDELKLVTEKLTNLRKKIKNMMETIDQMQTAETQMVGLVSWLEKKMAEQE